MNRVCVLTFHMAVLYRRYVHVVVNLQGRISIEERLDDLAFFMASCFVEFMGTKRF